MFCKDGRYGYLKDEADKNHLIVDEYAADVVRDIFKWKLEGMSPQDIAARLNHSGVLSPMEYKRSLGMRFATSFKANPQAAWSANAVLRILKNPVYTGVLIQGRETTPSYKVRKRVTKPENEWAIVSDAHEAIIERRDFDSVQKALSLDTRRSPGDSVVQLFSGMVFCGECGASMVRKTVPSGNKKYVYYVCAAHKQDKSCSPHRMRDEALEQLVLDTVKQYSGVGHLKSVRIGAVAGCVDIVSTVKGEHGLYLLASIGEVAQAVVLPFGSANFCFHAGGDAVAKDPHLAALAHQGISEEQS